MARHVPERVPPSWLAHESPDLGPVGPGQLPSLQLGKGFFQAQTEVVVAVEQSTVRQTIVNFLRPPRAHYDVARIKTDRTCQGGSRTTQTYTSCALWEV